MLPKSFACLLSISQGLGVLARRQEPQHVLAFIQTLLPMASAAVGVAQQCLADVRLFSNDVQQRWDGRQRLLRERLDPDAGDGVGIDSIREFFEQQRLPGGDQDPGGAETSKVALSFEESERLALLRHHLHAAATVAQAIADASSPLAVASSIQVGGLRGRGVWAGARAFFPRFFPASSLAIFPQRHFRTLPVSCAFQVSVQSMDVCGTALKALASATLAVEMYAQIGEMCLVPPAKPSDPADSPRLLPSVHLAWVPLMGAVGSSSKVSQVEAALQLLAEITVLSGTFLGKRWRDEALPALLRLLAGASSTSASSSIDTASSPSAGGTARMLRGIMECLLRIAACRTQVALAGALGSPSAVLLPGLHGILKGVLPLVESATPSLRALAIKLLTALAALDPDAAWATLHGLAAAGRQARLRDHIAGMPVPWHRRIS